MKQLTEVLSSDAHLHSETNLEPQAACPKLYCTEYAEQACKLCSFGLSEIDLADWFETDAETIEQWKSVHPEFRQAIDSAMIEADANVAAALYRRAVGYDVPAVKVAKYRGKVMIVTHRYKHILPNVKACMFWLKNRRPEQWGSLSESITSD